MLLLDGTKLDLMARIGSSAGKFLVKYARQVVEAKLSKKPVPVPEKYPSQLDESKGIILEITKTSMGILRFRGFDLSLSRPLIKSIKELAASSVKGGKYKPIEKEEMPLLFFDVIIINEPQFVEAGAVADSVEVGKHGLILYHERGSAILLPHEILENRWTIEEALKHLSFSAMLGPNEWRNAEIYRFTVDRFRELEPGGKVVKV